MAYTSRELALISQARLLTFSGMSGAQPATLEQRKAACEEDLRQIEKQIYELETNYLEETAHYGSVVKGWDNFFAAKPKTSTTRKNVKISQNDRIFSNSSVTAPTQKSLEHEDEFGLRDRGRSNKTYKEHDTDGDDDAD